MLKVNFYAEVGLDRVSHLRDDSDWIAERHADPETRLLPIWRSKSLFLEAETPTAQFLRVAEHGALLEAAQDTVLLGLKDGRAFIAVDLSHLDDPSVLPMLPENGHFADVRAHAGVLDRQVGAMLAYARGVFTWHHRHRFCGTCSGPTISRQAGHQRVCTNPDCGAEHFPRTDPAVIMLVTRGDRVLLGRQSAWAPGIYSTLAGFVEPGESLEEAVAREVFEESGIRVQDVRYHSSQPWPFPSSIMLGFHATAQTEEIHLNTDELEDARWFSRRFILSEPPSHVFCRSRPDSIARRLIDEWLEAG